MVRLLILLFPTIAALAAIVACATSEMIGVPEVPTASSVLPVRPLVLSFSSDDGAPVSAKAIKNLADDATVQWGRWQSEFDLRSVDLPPEIKVRFKSVEGLAGRSSGSEIEIGRLLAGEVLTSVFRHELAHVFLAHHAARNCPAVKLDEFYSEAFSQWTSQDENRILSGEWLGKQGSAFPYASQAREYLRDRSMVEKFFHDTISSQALARLIADSRRLAVGQNSLQSFFKTSIANCDFTHSSVSIALFGENQKAPLSREAVLILDGVSGEKLTEVGDVRTRKFPVASVLKPLLVAEFLEFQKLHFAKSTLPWICPDKNPGRPWSWSQGLVFSCNGFFLDSERPSKSEIHAYEQKLRSFGAQVVDDLSIEQLIGLHPGIEASPETVLALYSWLAQRKPEVIRALQETAAHGTLARLPDSSWFVRNEISLKSGTIRNAQGEPEHGWIVAIGRLGRAGRPDFLAVIHQRGSSPQMLLSRFRAHLQEALTASPVAESAKVQILGLVPRASIAARCENLILTNGQLSGQEPRYASSVNLAGFKEGVRFRCDRGPLWLKFPNPGGFQERSYWGEIEISSPGKVTDPKLIVEDSPSPRQARARRGSELILMTSERSYIAGVLASEFPTGRIETLKALALVVKFNLQNATHARHIDRPICDTTHCQVFGPRNHDLGVGPGEKYSKIAHEVSRLSLVGELKERWLMFSIGGTGEWVADRKDADVIRTLELSQKIFSIERKATGDTIEVRMGSVGNGLRRSFQCEKFRNLLRLSSCPQSAVLTDATWTFKGRGAGHGHGMDLLGADRLAAEGLSSRQILKTYFPGLEVK